MILQRLSENTITGDEDGITFMATGVIGKLESFEPGHDNWLVYTERLEQFFVANDIDADKKKVAVLLTAI